MDKLQMAHEYAKIMLDKAVNLDGENRDDYLEFIATFSYDLADSMIAEHDERQDKSRPEAIEPNSVVVRDGAYYQDHVNFDYYKFIEGQWYKLQSHLSDKWIKCSQPNLKWLVEDAH